MRMASPDRTTAEPVDNLPSRLTAMVRFVAAETRPSRPDTASNAVQSPAVAERTPQAHQSDRGQAMARALMLIVLSFFIFPTTAQLTDRAPLATKAQQGNGKLGMELVFDDSNLFRIRPFRPLFRPTPHNQLHCCTDDIFGAITCRCLR